MKQRKCNIINCTGIMRPTREMWDCNGAIPQPNHRIFQCVICGNRQPWLDKPKTDGSFCDLHRMKDGNNSTLSMLSDPEAYPPLRRGRGGELIRTKR